MGPRSENDWAIAVEKSADQPRGTSTFLIIYSEIWSFALYSEIRSFATPIELQNELPRIVNWVPKLAKLFRPHFGGMEGVIHHWGYIASCMITDMLCISIVHITQTWWIKRKETMTTNFKGKHQTFVSSNPLARRVNQTHGMCQNND
jgi:hypothetical protein